MPEPKITPDEAEQIRSGYLPPSAVPKVGPEIRRYFGLDDYPSETGALFDACSKFIVYALMGRAPGLESPADAYSLLGDLYSATGRFPQMCDQLEDFIRAQAATGRLYEAQGRDIATRPVALPTPA